MSNGEKFKDYKEGKQSHAKEGCHGGGRQRRGEVATIVREGHSGGMTLGSRPGGCEEGSFQQRA